MSSAPVEKLSMREERFAFCNAKYPLYQTDSVSTLITKCDRYNECIKSSLVNSNTVILPATIHTRYILPKK